MYLKQGEFYKYRILFVSVGMLFFSANRQTIQFNEDINGR